MLAEKVNIYETIQEAQFRTYKPNEYYQMVAYVVLRDYAYPKTGEKMEWLLDEPILLGGYYIIEGHCSPEDTSKKYYYRINTQAQKLILIERTDKSCP